MTRAVIQDLIRGVEAQFGPIRLFGTFPGEEEGTGFVVAGIPASFSVMIGAVSPVPLFDVQVMDRPPDRYLLERDGVDLQGLLALIDQLQGPQADWPT